MRQQTPRHVDGIYDCAIRAHAKKSTRNASVPVGYTPDEISGPDAGAGTHADRRLYASHVGRVIQSSGPLRYAIVDGMNVRDSRVHNYPPRWNAAPKQELLVIRRNHQTGEVSLDPLRWGLIPYWCKDPTGGRKPINATCETVRGLPTFRDAYRRRRCIVPVDGLLRVEGDQGAEGEAALRDCHEGRHAVRHRSQEAYGLGLKSKLNSRRARRASLTSSRHGGIRSRILPISCSLS